MIQLQKKVGFNKVDSTAIKGIALLMMLFHHCFHDVEYISLYVLDFRPFTKNFIVNLATIFKICVSIFAFVTGYGLNVSLKNQDSYFNGIISKVERSKWLVGRLINLLSRFWPITIMAYIICQIANDRTEKIFFGKSIAEGIIQMLIDTLGLSNLLNEAQFNGTWWYMSAAIVFICLIPLFYEFAKKYGYFMLVLLSIIIPRMFLDGYQGGITIITFILAPILGMMCAEYNLLVRIESIKLYKKNDSLNKLIKFVIATVLLVVLFKVYISIPINKYWDIHFGFIPVFVIYYCYEFIIGLPIVRSVLVHVGKHSMNIFLIHTFIRHYYFRELTYSFKHFVLIVLFLLGSSLVLSYVIEGLKWLIKYDKWIDKLIRCINNLIDRLSDNTQKDQTRVPVVATTDEKNESIC